LVATNPTEEPIISDLSVTRSQTQVVFGVAMKISQISKIKAAGENFDQSAEF
jgi:predicted secreted protein